MLLEAHALGLGLMICATHCHIWAVYHRWIRGKGWKQCDEGGGDEEILILGVFSAKRPAGSFYCLYLGVFGAPVRRAWWPELGKLVKLCLHTGSREDHTGAHLTFFSQGLVFLPLL